MKKLILSLSLATSTLAASLCLPFKAFALDISNSIVNSTQNPYYRLQCGGTWTSWRNGDVHMNQNEDCLSLQLHDEHNVMFQIKPESVMVLQLSTSGDFQMFSGNYQESTSLGPNGEDVIGIEQVGSDSSYTGQTWNVYVRNHYWANPNPAQFQIYLRIRAKADAYIRVSNFVQFYPNGYTIQDIKDMIGKTNNSLDEIRQQLEKLNTSNNAGQQMEDAKNEMEDAQNSANNSSDSSQSDADKAGQTLLEAFTSFVGALTSAKATNCNINMDTGFINFGVVDLCQLKPPAAFQAISSIVVIGFAVPLSLAAAKKMIELFRSFQT